MPSLANRVAIITGSSSGIGAAVATHFAKLGASVSITGRNEQNLKDVKAECVKCGATEDKVLITVGDITTDAARKQLVADTIKRFGRIDILVNNAGAMLTGSSAAAGDAQKLQQMWELNVMRWERHACEDAFDAVSCT